MEVFFLLKYWITMGMLDFAADVVKSAIGFLVYGSLLLAWGLTFAYGGEKLFGDSWKYLAVYNIADKIGQVRIR